MTSFTATTLRLLRGLVGGPTAAEAPLSGEPTPLDGVSAVALTESRVSDTAALGATYPAAAAGRAWAQQRSLHGLNALRKRLSGVEITSARGTLAAAIGASMSGQRATTFLSGTDLAASTDLLVQAVGRHVPLVIHLVAQAPGAHAQALGSGHEAYHAAASSGCVLLFALNVQEAADLALIARRVAEEALVPAVVCMDAEQTALAAQDVRLPEPELIRQFLGDPATQIDAPTDAQRLLLGATRRRVPRLFDLERPSLHGPLEGPESWALGAAGQRPYFASHVSAFLQKAFDDFAELTGRRYDSVYSDSVDHAEIILVGQGAAVEIATAVARHARAARLRKVGVLGVRCLRPLSDAAMAGALKGSTTAAVLERCASSTGDGPLLVDVRGVLDRAREAARFGEAIHPGCPPIPDRHLPRLVDVPCGLGGLPLRAADLLALVTDLGPATRSPIYLGVPFVSTRTTFPKHQALSDALRRGNPDLETLGLVNHEPPPDVRPENATTIALHRLADRHPSLAGEAAAVLHRLTGDAIRSRPALTGPRVDRACMDLLTCAPGTLVDPGDDAWIDIAVATGRSPRVLEHLVTRLAPKAAVLFLAGSDDEDPAAVVPASVLRTLQSDDRMLFAASPPPVPEADDDIVAETLLGGMVALLYRRRGESPPPSARLRAARDSTLAEIPDEARQRRVDAFVAAFENVRPIASEAAGAPAPTGERAEGRLPAVLQRLSRSDGTMFSLSRFWDHAGVLYQSDRTEELIAEPGLATGTIPPLTGALHDASRIGNVLPVLDPERCDGDPRLWMTCPDGSVAPLVIGVRALIDAGIALATERGRSVDILQSIASKLASRGTKIVAAGDTRWVTARQLLERSFEAVLESMDADESRRSALAAAVEDVAAILDDLPLVRTKPFFEDAEREKPGSGELFTLVINPDACRSAALVLATCADCGLEAIERSPRSIDAARRLWSLWELLPDTSGATIERAAQHSSIGPLAAAMLSRHCSQAAAGGDCAEVASGAKLALRRVLGLAERVHQPRLQKQLEEITSVRERLAGEIRNVLAEGLPTTDLNALAEGLELLGRAEVDLAALSSKVDTIVTGGHIDGTGLARKVEVARGLADLEWHLRRGPTGMGRSRVSVVLAPGTVARWAATFPYHAFQSPVLVDGSGEPGPFAEGLLDGQLRQVTAGLQILRLARQELAGRAETGAEPAGPLDLPFDELTPDERHLCPPLLVVGDEHGLAGHGLGQIVRLLGSRLPVKVIVLSDPASAADLGLGVDAFAGFPGERRSDVALLGLLARDAFVVQTSLAHDDHFARGVEAALAFDGPALIVVHAPSPRRHGFAPERLFEQARLAVETRSVPLLVFDPAGEGVFGSRLDLSANPDPQAMWIRDEDGRPRTPVDWAATESRFADHFSPLAPTDPQPTPIAEYLGLPAHERDGRTPFIEHETEGGRQRMRVSPVLAADAAGRASVWRTLQELAGVVTPFTERVRAEVEQSASESHQAEIEQLRASHEAQIAELRASFEAEATERITDGLLALVQAGAAAPNGQDEQP